MIWKPNIILKIHCFHTSVIAQYNMQYPAFEERLESNKYGPVAESSVVTIGV